MKQTSMAGNRKRSYCIVSYLDINVISGICKFLTSAYTVRHDEESERGIIFVDCIESD